MENGGQKQIDNAAEFCLGEVNEGDVPLVGQREVGTSLVCLLSP